MGKKVTSFVHYKRIYGLENYKNNVTKSKNIHTHDTHTLPKNYPKLILIYALKLYFASIVILFPKFLINTHGNTISHENTL